MAATAAVANVTGGVSLALVYSLAGHFTVLGSAEEITDVPDLMPSHAGHGLILRGQPPLK